MAKQKSQTDILIQGIKNIHPYYQGYIIDCLKKAVSDIHAALPMIVEEERENQKKGKISMFHPNFYVNFINEMNPIFDEIDLNYLKNYSPEKVSEFKPTEKVKGVEI